MLKEIYCKYNYYKNDGKEKYFFKEKKRKKIPPSNENINHSKFFLPTIA